MDTPLVSVVIPTYERADLLRRTLGALLRQTLHPAQYEIIVVDNNSADATRQTVERMATGRSAAGRRPVAVPDVRYMFEARQGLSHAKNAGLKAARGSIVAYIDDDALASPDWLRLIVRAFEQVEPAPHVVGGPAFPLLLGWRPSWYKDAYETASWGEAPRFLDRSDYFYGLNVAFLRTTLLGVGGFDTELGMRGEALGFAEDAEVMERLWEHAGGRLSVYYLPEAFVLHFIPDARVDPHYRLRRSFVVGQTMYQRESAASQRGPLGLWPRAVRQLARTSKKAVLLTPKTPPHYGNWMIERGVPLALAMGYLAAAAGVYVNVRRSH